MVNSPSGRKQDWHKLVKFVQFAYRRMYIPGTNLTPYMVARGRQPISPNEVDLIDEDEAPLVARSLARRLDARAYSSRPARARHPAHLRDWRAVHVRTADLARAHPHRRARTHARARRPPLPSPTSPDALSTPLFVSPPHLRIYDLRGLSPSRPAAWRARRRTAQGAERAAATAPALPAFLFLSGPLSPPFSFFLYGWSGATSHGIALGPLVAALRGIIAHDPDDTTRTERRTTTATRRNG